MGNSSYTTSKEHMHTDTFEGIHRKLLKKLNYWVEFEGFRGR